MTTAAPAASPTTFAAPGVAPAAPTADDSPVVFELNGRKFTAAELAKKLDNQDSFIETLKAERAEDRKLLTDAQDALKKAVGSKEVLAALAPAAPAAPAAAAAPADTATIVDQVRQSIKAEETAAKADANWKESTTALTAVLGANTDARVAEVAAEHGLSLKEMEQLARKSPTAFLKFFPEVQTKRPASSATFQSTTSTPSRVVPAQSTHAKSWGKANNTRDRVAAYTARLKELSGE